MPPRESPAETAPEPDGAILRGPTVEHPAPHGVPGLIRAWATETPEAVALLGPDGELTYRALELASDAVARELRAAGGAPGEIVAVCLPRGCELVVALLGAMKAGMPYLPLSPEDSPARRHALIRQARARFALVPAAEPGTLADLDGVTVLTATASGDGPREPDPLPDHGGAHPAYVLFTSGSSGEPKGVVVPSAALCNRLLWMREEYGFAPQDRILQKTPSTFDVSGWELWGPLISGAREILLPPGAHRDPGEVVEWITSRSVTVCHFVPSMLEEFLRWPGADRCTSLRMVVCSGEALTPGQVRRFRELLPAELHNLYGPTEAAIDVTYWHCPDDPDRVLIGSPIDNCTLVVVDDALRPVPAGRTGQLAIGGVVLATGYLHRPDLTEAAFVSAPDWCPVPRLYLTGDLVRRHGDALEYLGRRDDQIKIRGHRIELGEIEDALRDQDEVTDAAVVAVDLGRGLELCAFVVAGSPGDQDGIGALVRARLRERLPEACVPAHVLTAAFIPRTGSGKQDKRTLREEASRRLTRAQEVRPAGGDDLLDCWVEAMGAPPADEETGFLEAGGHSLMAARLAGLILRRWGTRVPLRAFLRDNVSLSALRDRLPAGAATPQEIGRPVLRPDRSWAPISPEQRRLWLWTRLFPASPAYNVVGVLDIDGELGASALHRACATVIGRHEVLRTTFVSEPDQGDEEVVRQRIHEEAEPLVREARSGDEPWQEAIRRFALEIAAIVFRPDRLPRVAFGLLRSGTVPARSCLVVSVDHLAADQGSLDVLLEDLAACYGRERGEPGRAPWPEEPPQYGDLVLLRRANADLARRERDLAYWRDRLRGAPRYLDLPFRKARPDVPTFSGDAVECDLGELLERAARARGLTPATLGLAIFTHVLASWAGSTDLVVGVPMSGRELEDEHRAVGFFVQTLPVRMAVPAGTTTGELLGPAADALLEAAEHNAVSFDEIVAATGVERDLSRNPVFQVWFNDLTQARPPAAFGGRAARALDPPVGSSLFDLGLYLLASAGGGHRMRLVYATDMWDADIAAEFLRQCRARLPALVPGASTSPEAAGPITGTEPARPSDRPRTTCRDLVARVAGWADRDPGRPALLSERGELSYAELYARVRRVSASVRSASEPGRLVAITAGRRRELAVAMLGCWHAGRPFLLLSPEAPRAVTEAVLAESGAAPLDLEAILEDARHHEAGAPADEDPPMAWPDGATGHALITSGTSGRPAIVSLPADALPTALDWYAAETGIDERDVFCFTVPPAHDPVFRDLILPLTLGARVHLPRTAEPGALLDVLAESGATVWHATPSQAAVLCAAAPAGAALSGLRRVVFHGEPLRDHLAQAVAGLAPRAELFNLYGTTETPQASGLYRWRPPTAGSRQANRRSVPVGHAVDVRAPRRLTVTRPDGMTADLGEVGELTVTGHGLALGYLGESRRVPPAPAGPAGRTYRTGDLARFGPGGEIELLGRTDRQVIVHGYRIELDGVERVVAEVPGIRTCAVAPDPRQPDALAAWIVAERPVSEAEITRRLRAMLPEWAIPTRFVTVATPLLTANGKLDLAALLAQEATTPATAPAAAPVTGAAPATATGILELIIDRARTFSGEEIQPDASFFDAGLTSLALVRLHERLTGADGLRMSLVEMFRHPSPRALATHLAGGGRTSEAADRRPARPARAEGVDEVALRRAARKKFRASAAGIGPPARQSGPQGRGISREPDPSEDESL